jgi:Ca-activated chloride channel family protein
MVVTKFPRGVLIVLILFLGTALFAAGQESGAAMQDPFSIKVSTDLVTLNVAVTQRNGGFVAGLQKEGMKVYEDNVEQIVSFFKSEIEPVSWGLILDRSISMKDMIRSVFISAVHIIDYGTDQDEMFIVTFNNTVELVRDFTTDKAQLRDAVSNLQAKGRTALWDAIGYGLDHVKKGKHRKKVLVVITDGDDNSSRWRFREIQNRAEEAEALIYTVGMYEMGGGSSKLSRLANMTGAKAHYPRNVIQCAQAMKQIAGDAGRQYSIGYYPSNAMRDGKWRKIQVVVQQPEPGAKYVVRTRAGYYASKGQITK